MPNQFTWTLTNVDTGATYVLRRDPRGWEELQLVHNRSEKYHGFFFDFSLSIGFSCKGQGKEFIDAAYEDKGSEANVELLLEYQCTPNSTRILFDGKLNYSTYKQEYKGRVLYTLVDVIQKGITQAIKNRENTDVDLLSTLSIGGTTLNTYDYAPYDIDLHSKAIQLETEWFSESFTNNSSTYLGGASQIPTGATRRLFHVPSVARRITDLDYSIDSAEYWIFTTQAVDESGITHIHDTSLASPIITPSSYDWSIETSGTFNWVADNPAAFGTLTVSFVIRKGTVVDGGTVLSTTVIFDNISTGDTTVNYSISDSGSEIMQTGDKIWYYWVVNYIATSGTGVDEYYAEFEVDDFDFIISTASLVETTQGKAVAIHEAWSRVMEGITDQTLAFKSEFFGRTNSQGLAYASNGYGSFTAITDGLRIRGFEQSDTGEISDGFVKKGIITNLTDMFDSCNAIWGVGLGIETVGTTQVARVEEREYFYQDAEILKFDNVPNIQMEFSSDSAYSSIEIGYAKWQIQKKGGLDETNSRAKWVFPKISSYDNQLSFVSPYIAGMYAIESTRRNNVAFNLTEDTQYDDNIFIIALNRAEIAGEPTGLQFAERDVNITVTGLLLPGTAYNLRFNLMSNFDRVMNQFTPGLSKDTPHGINFSYLEGNGNMTFTFDDDHPGDCNGITTANVQDTTYPATRHERGNPILLPEIYTFKYPVSFIDYIYILNNPYGYISFSPSDNNHLKGYIKTLNYSIKTKMAEFTLIRKFE